MAPTLSRNAAQVVLYAPYCGGVSQEAWLERALDLFDSAKVHGERPLRGGGSHLFELTWKAGGAPQELSFCELRFPATPEVIYRFPLPTHQLVSWLMDLLQDQALRGSGDLPEAFWRWLILGESPASLAA
jgi:hypothetical protein